MAPAAGFVKLPGSKRSARAARRALALAQGGGAKSAAVRKVRRVACSADLPLPADAFDVSEQPSAGTACAWCSARGHFCPAKGYAGELALCMACGGGLACPQAEAVERMRFGHLMFEVARTVAPVRRVALEEDRGVVGFDFDTHLATVWPVKATLREENLRRVVAVPGVRRCLECRLVMHPLTQGDRCRDCKRRLRKAVNSEQ